MGGARGAVCMLAFAAFACSGEPPESHVEDGGVDAPDAADAAAPDATRTIIPPAPPEAPRLIEAELEPLPPELPVFVPCPPGWREIATSTRASAVIACDPWPAGGEAACPDGEAHFLGEPGCAPIGPPCDPLDDWAPGLPATGVRYVQAGAAPGGAGTRAMPFATIAEALAAAVPGDIVALAKGAFDEEVRLEVDVELRGACVAETTVTTTRRNAYSTIYGRTGRVRTLTVSGTGIAFAVPRDGALLVEEVIVEHAQQSFVAAAGGRLEARRAVCRDLPLRGAYTEGELVLSHVKHARVGSAAVQATGAGAIATLTDLVVDDIIPSATGITGDAVQAVNGATMSITRASFTRLPFFGARVATGASSSFTDVVIRDVAGTGNGTGPAIAARTGGTVRLLRVLSERAAYIAFYVQSGGTLVIEDSAATDVAPIGGFGWGLSASGGATAQRLLVERSAQGVFVQRGGTGVFSDLVVRHTAGEFANGLHLEDNTTTASVTRALFDDTGNAGVIAALGARVSLRDVRVRDTRPSRVLQAGINLGGGAQMSISRSAIERSTWSGITVENAVLRMTDVVVRDTLEREAPQGLTIFTGSDVELVRCLFTGNVYTGIYGAGWVDADHSLTARLRLEDVIVRDTRADAIGRGGAGMLLENIELTGTRVLLERNHGIGLYVQYLTTGTISDLIVRDTQPAKFDTAGAGYVLRDGHGMIVGSSAQLTLDRALLERNSTVGVMVSGREFDRPRLRSTTLVATELEVRDIALDPYWMNGGGLVLLGPGEVHVAGARILRTRGAGVLASNDGETEPGRMTLSDLIVDDVDRDDSRLGFNDQASIGVASVLGAHIEMRNFSVARSEICGVQVYEASMDLYDGEVLENGIGANVQSDGFDINRLSRNVAYYDNGVDLDTTAQATPDLSTAAIGGR